MVGLLNCLMGGIPLNPLPDGQRTSDVSHAPRRNNGLSIQEQKMAVRNALRYFPISIHQSLAKEFYLELQEYGHIYMYRFKPTFQMRAYPIDEYPAKQLQCKAIMLMIMNNLNPEVAQFPEELITYGGNGQVFANWAQFWLTMKYLSSMEEDQTLSMYSGHPAGLFPSTTCSPKVVITNGMMVPNYSTTELYDKYFALGNTMYGQMTAGSYCYIGPQGIVHGTTITVLNAGRNKTGSDDLGRKVFLTAGLGGMSGAQAKAAVIAGCIGVVAEVCECALKKRYKQGWLMDYTSSLEECVVKIRQAREANKATSIGYLGNVVDLWEFLAKLWEESGEKLIDIGSDQTSCHAPFSGGYYPVGSTVDESNKMMTGNPEHFKRLVQESLKRQIAAIDAVSKSGMYFFDYGNAFLLECCRAGADVAMPGDNSGTRFRYPSYVQDIMGDIFSLGFGPFRWVCTSGKPEDLETADNLAAACFRDVLKNDIISEGTRQQYRDNLHWIEQAGDHKLVVGSQARILYADQVGRIKLALAFNDAIGMGRLTAPVVISRDHHDVSGTDSPFRETSNITDGSAFTADMAIQNVIGDSFRGATWVAIHNGGGTGWGEAINGGFGLVLDGSEVARKNAEVMLTWDVANGVARRSWAGNRNANDAIVTAMDRNARLIVTLPNFCDESVLNF